jgi:hypothetical protein
LTSSLVALGPEAEPFQRPPRFSFKRYLEDAFGIQSVAASAASSRMV